MAIVQVDIFNLQAAKPNSHLRDEASNKNSKIKKRGAVTHPLTHTYAHRYTHMCTCTCTCACTCTCICTCRANDTAMHGHMLQVASINHFGIDIFLCILSKAPPIDKLATGKFGQGERRRCCLSWPR